MPTTVLHDSMLRTLRLNIAGSWSTDDFIRLFSAVNAIYLYCVTRSRVAHGIADEYRPRFSGSIGGIVSSSRPATRLRTGKRLGFYSTDSELLKALAEKRIELLLVGPDMLASIQELPVKTSQTVDLVAKAPALPLGPLVTSVTYASPGDINFKGLGEPLKETREIIKDVAYGRNKAEARLRELEIDQEKSRVVMARLGIEREQLAIVKEKIEILKELGVSPDVIARALLDSDHLGTVHKLAGSGQITGIGELKDD